MPLERLAAAAGPTDAQPPFRFSAVLCVGFDETDAQAVVYYGRYLPYFDRARVEYLRHLGLLASGLQRGIEFVMRRSVCEYTSPARFDDPLEVFIRTATIGRTSTRFDYRVHHGLDGRLLTTAEQTLVLIGAADRRPFPIPDDYRTAIEAFEEPTA
jgi:acyl-CoA thioester hydrolase